MLQQPPPLFVQPKDLLRLELVKHPNSVYHKYQFIKDTLGKAKHQLITVKEMAIWLDVPETDIIQRIQ